MTWLSEEEWAHIQKVIPIVVVDIVLLSLDDPPLVGLIERNTPHQGVRWNLVGGRIRYGESIADALKREVHENLGGDLTLDLTHLDAPPYVAQYEPTGKPGFLVDPRKHAVALTYALPVSGTASPSSEAMGFQWFDMVELPPRDKWGFQQDRAAESCLLNVGLRPRFSP